MKKSILILITLLSITVVTAQSNFNRGYDVGYGKGYCYDQGIGCLKPITPIPPIPKIGENINSYTDGYNRGFTDGLEKRKSENQQSEKQNNNNGRKRYETTDPNFVDDFIYQPDWDLVIKALKIKEEQYKRKLLEWEMSEPERKENFKNQFEIATQHFNNKNYSLALNYCKSALSNGFHNQDIYYIMGLSEYALEDYDYAIIYLKEAKKLGHPNAQKYLNLLKEDEKKMVFQTNFPKFGVRAGYSKSDLTSSFVVGLWGQNSNIFGVKNFCWIPEFNYSKNEYISYRYDNGTYDTDEISNIQMNLLLFKNRIVRRLDVVYGIGGTVGFTRAQDVIFSCDANGGLRGYITHKLFLDTRIIKSVSNNDIPLTFQVALGYGF